MEGDMYEDDKLSEWGELLEDDAISAQEEGFLIGWDSWQDAE